jgi:predicted transposase YbfD/YdcC
MSIQLLNMEIKEFRDPKGRFYNIQSLFFIILNGISLGLRSVASIHRHSLASFPASLRQKLGIDQRFPSYSTLKRAMNHLGIDPAQTTTDMANRLLHLDGKSLRGGVDEGGITPHIVNLWDADRSILVGQQLTACGSGAGGERAAAGQMLKKTNVKGAIITADAGFSSGDSPQIITEAGADYLLRIKDNTPKLKRVMEFRVAQQAEKRGQKFTENRLAAGQLDAREIIVLPATALWSALPPALKTAQQFGVVRKTSTHKASQKVTQTEHYFITSLRPEQSSAADLLGFHRGHWRIENDLHRTKDMLLGEDKRAVACGKKAVIIGAVSSLAVSLLKRINASVAAAIDQIRAKPQALFSLIRHQLFPDQFKPHAKSIS